MRSRDISAVTRTFVSVEALLAEASAGRSAVQRKHAHRQVLAELQEY